MALHEKHCTLNPNRTCRMCKEPRNIPELVKLIPSAEQFHKTTIDHGDEYGPCNCDHYAGWGDTYKEPLQKVRDACDECPACIFSVIRQSKVPICIFDFDFKKEAEDWFAEKSEAAREQAEYAAMYG